MQKSIFWTLFPAPQGDIIIMATTSGICWVGTPGSKLENGEKFIRAKFSVEKFERNDSHPLLVEAKKQLEQYISGKKKNFSLPLDIKGTPFQKKVWEIMSKIPYGKSMTYGQIAAEVGSPFASRAVGGACGANPIPIIIPCHRVLAGNGRLGGYSGGLDVKKWLLGIEGHKITLSSSSTAVLSKT